MKHCTNGKIRRKYIRSKFKMVNPSNNLKVNRTHQLDIRVQRFSFLCRRRTSLFRDSAISFKRFLYLHEKKNLVVFFYWWIDANEFVFCDLDRSIKRNRILNFFRPRARLSDTNRESFLEKTSMKFINSREQTQVNNEWDDPKTRNIAFCAIVFNEFLKELAAITLEHSVQQFDDDQIFDDLSPISIML